MARQYQHRTVRLSDLDLEKTGPVLLPKEGKELLPGPLGLFQGAVGGTARPTQGQQKDFIGLPMMKQDATPSRQSAQDQRKEEILALQRKLFVPASPMGQTQQKVDNFLGLPLPGVKYTPPRVPAKKEEAPLPFQHRVTQALEGTDRLLGTPGTSPEERERLRSNQEKAAQVRAFYAKYPKDGMLGGYSLETRQRLSQDPAYPDILALENSMRPGAGFLAGLVDTSGMGGLLEKTGEISGVDVDRQLQAAREESQGGYMAGAMLGEASKYNLAGQLMLGIPGMGNALGTAGGKLSTALGGKVSPEVLSRLLAGRVADLPVDVIEAARRTDSPQSFAAELAKRTGQGAVFDMGLEALGKLWRMARAAGQSSEAVRAAHETLDQATYFKDVTDPEQLRTLRRELMRQNHPDIGGSMDAAMSINAEYDEVLGALQTLADNPRRPDLLDRLLEKLGGWRDRLRRTPATEETAQALATITDLERYARSQGSMAQVVPSPSAMEMPAGRAQEAPAERVPVQAIQQEKAGPTVDTITPEVPALTEAEYLGLQGLSSPINDYMIDKLRLPHGETQRQQAGRLREAEQAAQTYSQRRQAAIAEYRAKVARGEIRQPTTLERLLRTAQGHEDNESVQAARRALEKRGVNWLVSSGPGGYNGDITQAGGLTSGTEGQAGVDARGIEEAGRRIRERIDAIRTGGLGRGDGGGVRQSVRGGDQGGATPTLIGKSEALERFVPETRSQFIASAQSSGKQIKSQKNQLVAYRRASPSQISQETRAAITVLQAYRVPVDCYEGEFWSYSNKNGVTRIKTNPFTQQGYGIYLPSNIEEVGTEAAFHEIVHHLVLNDSSYVKSFMATFLREANVESMAFEETIKRLADFYGTNSTNRLLNEYIAYYCGQIMSEADTTLFDAAFHDPAAVRTAAQEMYAAYKNRGQGTQPPANRGRPITNLSSTGGDGQAGLNGGEPLSFLPPEMRELGEAADGLRGVARKAYQYTVSGQAPLERMQRTQAKLDGQSLIDASTQMVRQAGGSVDAIIEAGLVDRDGNRMGESYDALMKRIPKDQLTAFNDYAQNLHNISRQAQGKPVNAHTAQESAAIVEEYERLYPQFREYTAALDQWWDAFAKEWMVESGLVSQEGYAAMREMYPHYIPTYRVDKQSGSSGVWGKTVSTPKVVKKAKGGTSEIIPLEEAFAAQISRTVKALRYNELGQTLLDFARSQPEEAAKSGIRLSKASGGTVDLADIDTAMDTLTEQTLQELGRDGYILTVYEKGQPVRLDISREMWDALRYLRDNGLSEDAFKAMVNVGRGLTGWSKSAITGVNALFAVTNVIRDQSSYLINSISNNPMELTSNYAKAAWDVLRRTDLYQQYQALGGSRSGYYGQQLGYKKSAERAKPFASMTTGEKAKAVMGAPFRAMEKLGEFTEAIPRMAEYRNGLATYGDTPAGRRRAALAAADVTVNFSRTAPVTKLADAFTLYLNAQVQGLDKMARQLRNRPLDTVGKGLAIIMLPSILLFLFNKDNPHYQDLNDRTRDAYYLIPNLADLDGKGYARTFIKIPRSREYGIAMGAVVDRLGRYLENKDMADAFRGYGQSIASGLLPSDVLTDSYLAPFRYNLPSNRDFAGRTIVPQSLLDASPQYQYDARTSGIAKGIAGSMQWLPDSFMGLDLTPVKSPMKVDYLLDTYAGYPADLLQAATSPQAQGRTPLETAANAAYLAAVQPFERRFTADPRYQSAVTDRFYTAYDDAKRQAADRNLAENIPSEAVTPEEKRRSEFAKAAAVMADLRRQEQQILKQPGAYSDKERKIDALRDQLNGAARQAMEDAERAYRAYSRGYVQEISHLSEKQQETAKGLKRKGVSYDVYLEFLDAAGGMQADKDRNGNPISGSKKEKVYQWLRQKPGLSPGQKSALFAAAGYKEEGRYRFR